MTKHLPTALALAASAIFAFAAPAARADALYGTLQVYVWTGTGVTDTATLAAVPGNIATATASFNYNGPLNFVNNSPNGSPNTFADFFNSNGLTNYANNISAFNSSTDTFSQFLSTTMSTPGFQDNTYMAFVGTYTTSSPAMVTVSHDDGASLYYLDTLGNVATSFESGGPTSDITSTGTLPTGSNVPFALVYVESNGAPADLTVTGLSPVPEPGTIGLMALGLIGLGVLMHRGSAFNS